MNLRIADEITASEFQLRKKELNDSQIGLQNSLANLHKNRNAWLDRANSYLNFAKNAEQIFELGVL